MKRLLKAALLLGALGAAFLLGQSTSNFDKWWTRENDALAAAPRNHKVLFENDEVRVLEVTVPPGVPAVDRGHKDDEEVIFLPVGPPHQMENLESNKSLKAIRVELKKAR